MPNLFVSQAGVRGILIKMKHPPLQVQRGQNTANDPGQDNYFLTPATASSASAFTVPPLPPHRDSYIQDQSVAVVTGLTATATTRVRAQTHRPKIESAEEEGAGEGQQHTGMAEGTAKVKIQNSDG